MITEFIPLLFMPDKTKLGKVIGKKSVTPAEAGVQINDRLDSGFRRNDVNGIDRIEYAFKMIAAARLYFMNDIRNIQTSWVKMGWENALKSLSYGANDMSGTLYHENITREAGGENGEYTPREKFISEILRIDKIPVERDTIYSFQKQAALTPN
jgi:2-iminoacetate synthase ThiH